MYNIRIEKDFNMFVFICSLILLLVVYIVMMLIAKLNIKMTVFLLVCIGAIVTVGIGVIKPVMHKPLSMSVIEYLIHVNDDGSMTTTKKTTTTNLGKTK